MLKQLAIRLKPVLYDNRSDRVKDCLKHVYFWTRRTLDKGVSSVTSIAPLRLDQLATMYGTDKAGEHSYTRRYQKYFSPLRDKHISLLEIGVGGYQDPRAGGESLRMWKAYFKRGRIFGIDIYNKEAHNEERIKVFQGSQVDEPFLASVCKMTGPLDVIIDDGSHINEHVIKTFSILFPRLKQHGIYVIEDIQTSYWEKYGGDVSASNPNTIMNYFKTLTDRLNHSQFADQNFEPSYLDRNIVSISFYHNMICIEKGSNDEPSNLVSRPNSSDPPFSE